MSSKTGIVLEKHIVSELSNGKIRIYDYLPGKLEIISTRKGVKKAFQRKQILLNGVYAKSADFVENNDEIKLLERNVADHKVYDFKLEVVYEDDEIAVVVKPAGLVVSGNRFKTLQNALSSNLKQSHSKDKLPNPLTTHRIDAQTYGLVIVAKTYSSRIKIGELFEKRKIHKTYHAIVQGKLNGSGRLDTSVQEKHAETLFTSLKIVDSVKNRYISLMELSPSTGRKHQIRIHLARLGFPIIGDKLYGSKENTLKHKGLFLAATSLKFYHPKTGELLKIKIAVPNKFLNLLNREQNWYDRLKTNSRKTQK